MIKRLVLPKRLANPAENGICGMCRRTLNPIHNPVQRNSRHHQQMNVIRHDYEGVQRKVS
jgi:hypothetical protein